MAKKWVVKEITYPDMNSGLEEQAPVGWKKSELPKYNDFQKKQMEEIRQNYIDAWYTNKPWDVYFYSPEWVKTWVRYTWEFDTIPWDYQDVVAKAKQNRLAKKEAELQQWLKESLNNLRETNNWWQTAGSTVPQNAQNATQNQNGTSVSKYDWTDGKGNITVWPQNANLNYYQYWDDSNPNQQWQKGWMNEKYTWEWVSNTYIEYNPDVTLADLDPNYLYWENARQQNRKEAWYIARRNDMIASALYNEWKVSKEEVAEFLSQQNEWMNSTEADRLNTIESVWKRLWQIQPKEEPQADFNKDTSGKIYGKTTAEEWNPREWIDTLSDDNSVFNAINAARVRKTDEMYDVWVDNLAATKYYGTWAYSEQEWRDFSLRYPETAALVEQKVKEMKAQDTVNAVTNGTDLPSNTNTVWAVNNNIADFSNANATSTTSSAQITKNINTILDNNQTAQTAQELMWTIEWEMATLKNRLKNLREEANSKFKWDAPDYLVNAYMNNKSQEIQNQLSILEDRYNAAYKRYTTEVSQAQWQQEFDLKKQQLKLQQDEFEYKKTLAEQWISTNTTSSNTSTSSWKVTTLWWRELNVTNLSRDEIWWELDDLVDMVNNWQIGNAQCAAWIQKYYLPKLWISIPNLSSWDSKKWICTDLRWEYNPQKWDLIIMSSPTYPDNWHIWIVIWEKDWYIEFLDWNGSWNETPKVRKIKADSDRIYWYLDVTKWQQQSTTTTSSNIQWEEKDYANFETYLDPDTNQTTAKTIAMKYGFWDDYLWMTNFAREQLKNRGTWTADTTVTVTPQWDVSINEQGRTVITPTDWWEPIVYAPWITADYKFIWDWSFDPVLWYDTALRDTYEEILKSWFKSKWVLSEYAETHWRTPDQMWQEARNYQVAKDNWTDLYSDLRRKVTRDYGFAVGKADVYNRLDEALSKTWQLDWKWENFVAELWIEWPLEQAIEIASDELANFKKYQWEAIDEYWNVLRDLEFIIMQDASYIQRQNIMDSMLEDWTIDVWDLRWEWADWAVAYNHLKATEVFNQLADAKQWWVSLYPVSDADMKMVRNAATPIDWGTTDYSFKQAINNKYKILREKVWMPISDEQLEKMWDKEGGTLTALWWLVWINPDFSDYITIDNARFSWLLGWWDYWTKKEKSAYKWITWWNQITDEDKEAVQELLNGVQPN